MPPRSSTPFRGRCGFTLIELLAVIAVVALLAGLLFSALTHVRAMAQQTHCANNLRELARLANLQATENGGWVPQAMFFSTRSAARPNLRDYGMTDELMQCPSAEFSDSYGINNKLVQGSDIKNKTWGANDVQYWQHGRYQLA